MIYKVTFILRIVVDCGTEKERTQQERRLVMEFHRLKYECQADFELESIWGFPSDDTTRSDLIEGYTFVSDSPGYY